MLSGFFFCKTTPPSGHCFVLFTRWKMKVSSYQNQNFHFTGSKKFQKLLKRNLNRRLRRRRSKLRYYSYLKSLRIQRKTNDLCEAITVFDITDMEWSPLVPTSTIEVDEWQKQEQIAYWKSRALSLEYENKMLIQHIRNVYAKQTEDYANYLKENGEDCYEESRSEENVDSTGKKKDDGVTKEALSLPKRRKEEMEMLYGKKAAKIMGMETAVQLNYDLHLEDAGKITHWPHTPLNLKFD